MWRRLYCWRGKPSKLKGSGDLRRICLCSFAGDWGEICFRLAWWGKGNERFGKSEFDFEEYLEWSTI